MTSDALTHEQPRYLLRADMINASGAMLMKGTVIDFAGVPGTFMAPLNSLARTRMIDAGLDPDRPRTVYSR
jgi:hypothetical protein